MPEVGSRPQNHAMKQTRKQRRVGFTLVELLVVISIIALLIAILLPSLKKARIQAKNAKCASQLHDIGIALMAYATEYGRFPPQNKVDTGDPDKGAGAGFFTYSVHQEIGSYMGGLSRSDDETEVDANGQVVRSKQHEVFYCPFVPEDQIRAADGTQLSAVMSGLGSGYGIAGVEDNYLHVSYAYYGGLNEVINDPAKVTEIEDSYLSQRDADRILRKRKDYAKKEPHSGKVIMADTVMLWGGGKPEWRVNHGVGWAAATNASRQTFAPPKKFDGANELFGDAHVEWKSRAHFPELTNAPKGPLGWAAARTNCTFRRDGDFNWW